MRNFDLVLLDTSPSLKAMDRSTDDGGLIPSGKGRDCSASWSGGGESSSAKGGSSHSENSMPTASLFSHTFSYQVSRSHYFFFALIQCILTMTPFPRFLPVLLAAQFRFRKEQVSTDINQTRNNKM